ncbi:uncharacterized protein A4U43_C06F5330 [Asparagus officinalis]|uniref:Uncharacterized protein n=1 Tax=Asparagus officinalis TaxID=4686 RepID=A0A5P1EJZ2_ASPOF|nr:uncharacterized protein A4U43_C06F5330 [Asparagus officinalis]
MDPDTALFPSSPTNSSPSSSDLDTESTGSFFPDRSTTLGTLMGVNFPSGDPAAGPVRVPSTAGGDVASKKAARGGERRKEDGAGGERCAGTTCVGHERPWGEVPRQWAEGGAALTRAAGFPCG